MIEDVINPAIPCSGDFAECVCVLALTGHEISVKKEGVCMCVCVHRSMGVTDWPADDTI